MENWGYSGLCRYSSSHYQTAMSMQHGMPTIGPAFICKNEYLYWCITEMPRNLVLEVSPMLFFYQRIIRDNPEEFVIVNFTVVRNQARDIDAVEDFDLLKRNRHQNPNTTFTNVKRISAIAR